MKWLLLLIALFPPLFAGEMVPRRVIAFWDKEKDKHIYRTRVHTTLEMPLNHLGIDLVYHEIEEALPDLSDSPDIIGALITFNEATVLSNPLKLIDWAVQAINQGKKIVVMYNPALSTNKEGLLTQSDQLNRLYAKLGFYTSGEWVEHPFAYSIASQKAPLFPFEKPFPHPLPGFLEMRIDEGVATSYLTLETSEAGSKETDLVIISKKGGYISKFYANNFDEKLATENPRELGWYIDPFQFFRLAFDLPQGPIPDTTTLAGRRIFYSTCDGDAWNFSSRVEKYRKSGEEVPCARVLLEEIIKPNPDIPISVAIVAADLDPDWVGQDFSQDLARDYFALKQVNAATHTFSHPFDWGFFKTGGADKEINFLYNYPYETWKSSYVSWFRSRYYQFFRPAEFDAMQPEEEGVIPRAYATEPFELSKEISGSVDYLNQFAPETNKVNVMQWSGNSLPWDTPVKLCYEAGIQNHGAGSVRFDEEYPSYLYVAGIGRTPGGWVQVYTSANSDFDYSYDWSKRFYGLQLLPATLENTDKPLRIKPIHLYYHSYSGQFDASVNAIKKVLEYIRSQDTVAITLPRFCDIGEGFYSTQIENLSPTKWRIHDRKGIDTFRFDASADKSIDVANSKGVIGFTHHEGSLYVYLDDAIREPEIALIEGGKVSVPYLIESSWEIWDLKRDGNTLRFKAKGWGPLEMRWSVPSSRSYTITSVEADGTSQQTRSQVSQNQLHFTLPGPNHEEVEVTVQ